MVGDAPGEAKGDLAAAVMLRARIAADEPAFAGTPEGQQALHDAYALTRRLRPTYAEQSQGYRDSMREAGRGGLLP